MNERTIESKVEVKKKADIALLLPSSLLMGLKKYPLNPTLRAAALSRFKIPIPDSKKTFKAIEEWVQETIDPQEMRPAPPSPDDDAFSIEVCVSEVRSGRADWTANASGSTEYSMPVDRMEDIVSELADGSISFDEVVRQCRAELYDMATEEPPELEEEDYEYNDHECMDSSDWTSDVNMTTLRRRVYQYIALHHPDIPLPSNLTLQ